MKKLRPEIKLLVTEYESGLSTHELAAKYSVAQSYVYNHLKNAGVTFRKRGARIRLPKEHIKKAIELYVRNKPLAIIMQETGIANQTLYKYLDAYNIPRRRTHTASKLHKDSIIEGYKQGATIRDLSHRYHMPWSTVRSILARNDVPLRKRGGISKNSNITTYVLKIYEATELYTKTNMPLNQILSRTGLGKFELIRHLRACKIQPRKK